MPQKSPSDVRLLTPALLREIRAKVLRWVRDNPANIRALMLQGVEMMESIIRYNLLERLGPATPKTPVLGGIGVAYAPDDYDESSRYLQMDTGMSIYDVDGAGLPLNLLDPITVYGGETLRGYDGTVMPDSTTDYLIGQGTGAVCPTFSDTWTWGSQGEYTSTPYFDTDMSELFSNNCNIAPASYTGLLRLAAQAKLGAGQSVLQLAVWQKTPCRLDPATDGIFKDANGVYWLIRTDDTGCKAGRLKTDNYLAQCIQQWLADDEFTGSDIVRAEAYVMSTLEPDSLNGSPIEYELLTSTQMAPVYDSNRLPIGDHGWHYSRGHHGVDAGAVYQAAMVVHGVINNITEAYRTAYLYTITFNFTGATPSASIALDEQFDWELNHNLDGIFYNTLLNGIEKNCHLEPSVAGIFSPRGVGAPIYCYYRTDGREVIRYSYRQTIGPRNDTISISVCAPGTLQQTYLNTFGLSGSKGGFTTDLDGFAVDTPYYQGDKLMNDVIFSVSTAGIHSCTKTVTFEDNITDQCAVAGWDDNQSTVNNYEIGVVSGWRREIYSTSIYNNRYIIIPHGDAEACYMVEVEKISESGDVRNTVYSTPPSNFVLAATVTRPDDNLDTGTYSVKVFPGITPGGITICNGKQITNQSVSAISDDENVPLTRCKAGLVTSGGLLFHDGTGELVSQDFDDWFTFTDILNSPNPDNCTAPTVWTQGSYYHGDVWYSFGPSTLKKLSGEYLVSPQPTSLSKRVIPLGWN